MAMLLSMGTIGAISANAVDDTAKTVTVTSTYGGTYDVYKVLTATANDAGTAYNYAYAAGFSNANGYEVSEIADVDATNASAIKTLADVLVNDATKANVYDNTAATAVDTLDCSSSSDTTSLTPGYYLIYCTGGTQMSVAPMLVSVRSDSDSAALTLTPKTSSITVDKNITAVAKGDATQVTGSKDSNTNSNTAQVAVGNLVSYEIVTTIPRYASTVDSMAQSFQVIDEADAGLSVQTNSIAVSVDGTDVTTNADVVDSITSNTSGFTITFKNAYVLTAANQGKSVRVTFDAKVLAAALTAGDGTNVGKISFDNDYYTAGSANPTVLTDTTEVYTAKLTVTKNFSDNPSSYPVATFTLRETNASGAIIGTASTSSTNNVLEFNELAAGTYYLEETTTPGGYHTADPITFTVSASTDADSHIYTGVYTITSGTGTITNGNVVTESITNTQGSTLPGTGGMGTIMFTVGGAAIILFAGVMFVLYIRKRRSEEE